MNRAYGPGTRIVTVCSDVGRGHPSYLDSVLAALRSAPGFGPGLLAEHSAAGLGSPLNRRAWELARAAYRFAGTSPTATWLYNRTRSGGPGSVLGLGLLGAGIRRRLAGFDGVCVVDHPLLARSLAPACRVVYLHAEIAAPRSSVVHRAWRTLVPLPETAAECVRLGAWPDRVAVTGLVIEPALARSAEADAAARLERIRSGRPLTVGFFTSGAYPRRHVELMALAARSVEDQGCATVVFAGDQPERAAGLVGPGRTVVTGAGRHEATSRECGIIAGLDVMVAAAHERTGRAVGLGLPMFCVLPHIGPFAPLNYRFAHARGVCEPIATPADARGLGPRLAELSQSGRLETMARRGRSGLAVDGAARSARLILEWAGVAS